LDLHHQLLAFEFGASCTWALSNCTLQLRTFAFIFEAACTKGAFKLNPSQRAFKYFLSCLQRRAHDSFQTKSVAYESALVIIIVIFLQQHGMIRIVMYSALAN
jgi:hypothetical protein